jgi:hypothetical protein
VVAARLRRRGHSPHRPTASITRAIALDFRRTSLLPRPPGCRNLRSRRLPPLCTGCYLCRPSENCADLGGGRLGELVCVFAGLVEGVRVRPGVLVCVFAALVGDVRVRPSPECVSAGLVGDVRVRPSPGVRFRRFGGRRTRPASPDVRLRRFGGKRSPRPQPKRGVVFGRCVAGGGQRLGSKSRHTARRDSRRTPHQPRSSRQPW